MPMSRGFIVNVGSLTVIEALGPTGPVNRDVFLSGVFATGQFGTFTVNTGAASSELREDLGFELREDGGVELRE